MIKLKRLSFGNCLPFGDNIVIELDRSTTTQLVGKNGSGKSSIPLILEELLYNKNSKGVAKGDILNRYSGASEYWITLSFEVDAVKYLIQKTVKSTTKVLLQKENEEGALIDISGHTTTQTYKNLVDILGMDMATFSKLVYQSLTSSLDFLTATDGNRKKFLIGLLNLSKYSLIETEIKDSRKDLKTELDKKVSEKSRISKSISSVIVPDILEEKPAPESTEKDYEELLRVSNEINTLEYKISELQTELGNAEAKAEQSKQLLHAWEYKVKSAEQLEETKTALELYETRLDNFEFSVDPVDTEALGALVSEIASLTKERDKLLWEIDNIKTQHSALVKDASITNCRLCKSPIDKTNVRNQANNLKEQFELCKVKRDEINSKLLKLETEKTELLEYKAKYEQEVATYNELVVKVKKFKIQKLNQSSDINMKSLQELLSTKPIVISVEEVVTEIDGKIRKVKSELTQLRAKEAEIKQQIAKKSLEISRIEEYNLVVKENNIKRQVLLANTESLNLELNAVSKDVEVLSAKLAKVDLLTKVFGPKGLIAYKLETCVKVFESKVNEYLSSVSNGKFALGFELDEANLKVVVYSSGVQVNIKTLSSGELSKVNISTLLSIRSLMSSVSKNSLNVLFLDEVVSTIDEDGMEDLIEVLIKEHNLNTFVVSHNYQHPLVEVLKVIKENDISKVDYGN